MGETDTLYYDIEKDRSAMLSTSFPSSDYREEIAHIETLAATWRRQRRLIASPEALRSYEEDFLVRMAYNSNAIEGSTLTLAETEIIYEGEFVPGKPGREQIAARGIFEGHDFLARCSADKRPFDKSLILDTHERCALDLQPAARGIYRNAPAIIRASRTTPTSPLRIRKEMDDLIFHFDRLVQESSPLLACAWFHAAFEAIHPFADGNGRAGRLLLNAQLESFKFAPVAIKASHALEYKGSLERWQADGDDAPFVLLLLACETEELEKRLEFLAQFPEDAKSRAPLDERVLELLHANPSSSARELANALDVSTRHMQRVMKQLQEEGKLRHIGPKKGGHWEVIEKPTAR